MEKVRRLTDWVVSKAHEMCSDGNQVAERNGEDELAEGTRHLAGTSGAALTMNFQRAFPSRPPRRDNRSFLLHCGLQAKLRAPRPAVDNGTVVE